MLKRISKRAKAKVKAATKGKTVTSLRSQPDSEKVRERAYLIWERKGKPQNASLNNWLEAERELTKR